MTNQDNSDLFDVPKDQWEHIVITEDGELIPMRFAEATDNDIQWALRRLWARENE